MCETSERRQQLVRTSEVRTLLPEPSRYEDWFGDCTGWGEG